MATPEAQGAIISRHLDTVGDGSGTKNAVGNYASAATDFLIKPASGEEFNINRMIVAISDTGNFSADGWGAGSALTNGVTVQVEDDSGVKYTLTDPDSPIKANAQWANVCYDVSYLSFGVGDNWLGVRWTFARSGKAVTLVGGNGDKLVVTLNDDMTGLVSQRFMVQGFRYW